MRGRTNRLNGSARGTFVSCQIDKTAHVTSCGTNCSAIKTIGAAGLSSLHTHRINTSKRECSSCHRCAHVRFTVVGVDGLLETAGLWS